MKSGGSCCAVAGEPVVDRSIGEDQQAQIAYGDWQPDLRVGCTWLDDRDTLNRSQITRLILAFVLTLYERLHYGEPRFWIVFFDPPGQCKVHALQHRLHDLAKISRYGRSRFHWTGSGAFNATALPVRANAG